MCPMTYRSPRFQTATAIFFVALFSSAIYGIVELIRGWCEAAAGILGAALTNARRHIGADGVRDLLASEIDGVART